MLKLNNLSLLNRVFLLAIILGIGLRIILAGNKEFWYDEVLSLLLVTGQKSLYKHPGDLPILLDNYRPLLSLPIENNILDIFQTLEKLLKGLVAEPHPPLFYLGQHFWLRLWGNSEGAMRSLNILYSIGAIISSFGLGQLVLGKRGGLFLAALVALNPFFFFHSLNVRMYCPLVFWTIFTSWCLLELIELNRKNKAGRKWLWISGLILGTSAGFLTFYYFACFIFSLGILAIFLDRKRWWQYGVYLGLGVIINIPWLWWGTRQQLRNADLGRFNSSSSWIEAIWLHTKGVLDVLGIHLLLGDWASNLPPVFVTWTGLIAGGILSFLLYIVWQKQQYRLLGTSLILGIVPLFLMLSSDVISGKFTLSFGWGRSMIFILPGCLLLLAAGIDKAKPAIILVILALYLTLNIADWQMRPRWMFHQIAAIIEQESNQTTLIAMNSPAWGHVLRLVYYLPDNPKVMLLARKSEDLTSDLIKALDHNNYQRIIWLDSARPVWGQPSTEEQRQNLEKNLIIKQYKVKNTEKLSGTWELDNFTAKVYQHLP